jgi:hypothetical protein
MIDVIWKWREAKSAITPWKIENDTFMEKKVGIYGGLNVTRCWHIPSKETLART